jgi:hypothetical protein
VHRQANEPDGPKPLVGVGDLIMRRRMLRFFSGPPRCRQDIRPARGRARLQREMCDVVVGVVSTHDRGEVSDLLQCLETNYLRVFRPRSAEARTRPNRPPHYCGLSNIRYLRSMPVISRLWVRDVAGIWECSALHLTVRWFTSGDVACSRCGVFFPVT